MNIEIKLIEENKLSSTQLRQIAILNEEAFRDVPEKEAEENFIAKSFARLIAYDEDKVVGTLRLFRRQREFNGKSFLLGGIGGVCVVQNYRGKGIGKALVNQALAELKKEKCDVACLNADLEETVYKLYEKAGFRLMEREISFENSKSQIVRDTGTMFIPLLSSEIYNLIMSSDETFHYGVGYW